MKNIVISNGIGCMPTVGLGTFTVFGDQVCIIWYEGHLIYIATYLITLKNIVRNSSRFSMFMHPYFNG